MRKPWPWGLWDDLRFRVIWGYWFYREQYGKWDMDKEPVPAPLAEVIRGLPPRTPECPAIRYVIDVALQREDADEVLTNHLFTCSRCGYIAATVSKGGNANAR